MRNTYLWLHILGGGILTKIAIKLGTTDQVAVLSVLGIAILWEIFEYLKDDVVKIYGSKKRFYLDSLQDIFFAVLMALVVAW